MASDLLATVDERLATCRARVERLRRVVSAHPEWTELARVLELAEESLRDLHAHRALILRRRAR